MSLLYGEHALADRFHALTPEAVLSAVESQGRRCTGRFITLNSYENRVYQLELDDESMVVGKFYRPGRWSVEAIQDEHDFIFELADDEIPACAPMELSDGFTIGTLHGDGAGIHYALFPRIGGRCVDEPTDAQLRALGRLVARIHNVGDCADAEHRPELSPATYGRENLDVLLTHGLLPPGLRDAYRLAVEALITVIEPLFEDVPIHRIHGDCHFGNLLWTEAGPTFLDFDDMAVGPAVQDLWLLAPGLDPEGHRQRALLVDGYSQFRDFDPAWLRLVEPLRALRFIHYATWIARRWSDPIFKRTFTHFGSAAYWQQEVDDLQEQIARIEEDEEERR